MATFLATAAFFAGTFLLVAFLTLVLLFGAAFLALAFLAGLFFWCSPFVVTLCFSWFLIIIDNITLSSSKLLFIALIEVSKDIIVPIWIIRRGLLLCFVWLATIPAAQQPFTVVGNNIVDMGNTIKVCIMKPFAKLMIAALILLGIGLPMVMTGPNGKPIMTINDWIPDISGLKPKNFNVEGRVEHLKSLTNLTDGSEPTAQNPVKTAVDNSPGQLSASSGKMYKWQDENGRWHFSSEKPTAAVEVSVEQLPEMENFMQAPVKEEENNSSISLPGGFSL
ncbi:DUF4124 domain-containing protein [Oceanicoccus sp. KOV_DT_Chl]|uniref:DUF4124 domain-containing protein n=1 Tax=Oceanicoccus sp. KOV_DT_Chl TaxID=1904639 RepID=UPI0011AF65E3|nr:DUF4124 domain-containing protein [Oceanicoccus sp. KOV_DT_Chl]